MSAGQRSESEETGIHDTKVSDSGYSNSCSNSQSQRSSGSSESRHSSSSGSSGYCGHQTTLGGLNEGGQQQAGSKRKDKDHKKKKGSKTTVAPGNVATGEDSATPGSGSAQAATQQASTTVCGTDPSHITAQDVPITITAQQGHDTNQQANSAPAEQSSKNVCDGKAARTPTSDSEALQIAALAQTLTCIKKFKCKEKTPSDDLESSTPPKLTGPNNQEQIISCLKVEPTHDEELYIVVSLRDGIVLHTTPNITDLLGFPKDMWIGRSLIDFVHPKHRVAFASHITSIIANPLSNDPSNPISAGPNNSCSSNGKRSNSNLFFCCLRQYRGLRSAGFSVTDKRVGYLPCQLTTTFREVAAKTAPAAAAAAAAAGRLAEPIKEEDDGSSPTAANHNCVFLVITATAVRSAYKYGDEVKTPSKFMTRHLANCLVSHVDSEVMPYFGYLPQDMIGHSVFDYYHPEDLRYIKDAYQSVMKDQGQPMCTKPYRFRCQNGGFALVETEWSSFINPWSRKLEFVIGQHTVLRGPPNPDVTTPVNELEPVQVPEEVLKESKTLQEEIKCLLSETVVHTAETAKQQVSKRCKDLATFMEALMDTKPHDLKVDVLTEDHSFSERDSVMLGEISPHHEYYNSKASSETPPSYNQLNYNENLQRFFESQPKTTLSDELDTKTGQPMLVQSNSSAGDDDKMSPVVNSSDASVQRQCCFAKNLGGSGTSSGQSTETNSNGNCGGETTETTNTTDTNGYKPPTLTEQLLSKHNEDMEKQMMQKHRELRSKGEGKNKDRHKTAYDKMQDDGGGGHGIKRSGSHSWEGEPYKSMKQAHTTETAAATMGAQTASLHHSHHHHHHAHHHHHQQHQQQQQHHPHTYNSHGQQSTASASHHHKNTHNHHSAQHQQHRLHHQKQQQQQQPGDQQQQQQQQQQRQQPKVNLWPPFSVGMTPLHTTPPNFSTPTLASPIVPMYYVPEPPRPDTRPMRAFQHPAATYITQQVPYMPGMVYHPLAVFGTPPVVYSPLTVLPSASVYPPASGSTANQQPPPGARNIPQKLAAGKVVDSSESEFAKPSSRLDLERQGQVYDCHRPANRTALSERGKQISSPGILSPNLMDKKQDNDGDSNGTSNPYDDSSNYSSFYSFLKTTDKSDDSMKSSPENDGKMEEMIWEKSDRQNGEGQTSRPIKKVAPWMEDINVTSDLLLKYQLRERHLKDVLEEDFKALERINQPSMVNDQLSQMYLDLELEGLSKQLTLEEGITSSSESSGDDTAYTTQQQQQQNKKKRYMEYDKMVIVYEENAPLPPPPFIPTPCN